MKQTLTFLLFLLFTYNMQCQITVNTQNKIVSLDENGDASISVEDINNNSSSVSCFVGMEYENTQIKIVGNTGGKIDFLSAHVTATSSGKSFRLRAINTVDNRVRAGDLLVLICTQNDGNRPSGESISYNVSTSSLVWGGVYSSGNAFSVRSEYYIYQTGKSNGDLIDFQLPFSFKMKYNNTYIGQSGNGFSTFSSAQDLTAELVSGSLGNPCLIQSITLDKENFDCSDNQNRYANSLDFNNSSVSVALTNMPAGNDSRTISFWVKSNVDVDPSETKTFLDYGDNYTGRSIALYARYGGVYLETYNRDIRLDDIPVVQDQWFHVTVTHNGSETKLYYNGVLKGTLNYALNTANHSLHLGRSRNGGHFFDGNMSNLKIYDTALIANEVKQDMMSELPVDPTSIIYHFKFNQTTGNAVSTGTSLEEIPVGSGNTMLYGSEFPLSVSKAQVVTLTVTDEQGNSANNTAFVNVIDVTSPEITLNGAEVINVYKDDVYTDPGAIFSDNCAVNNDEVIVRGDSVDTSTEGAYTVAYNVVDTSNNTSEIITRTVNVIEGSTLSLSDSDSSQAIKLYPNPVKSGTVLIDFSTIEGEKQISVYNAMGQSVLRKMTSLVGSYKLEVGQLPASVYFVKVKTQDVLFSQKLIIE